MFFYTFYNSSYFDNNKIKIILGIICYIILYLYIKNKKYINYLVITDVILMCVKNMKNIKKSKKTKKKNNLITYVPNYTMPFNSNKLISSSKVETVPKQTYENNDYKDYKDNESKEYSEEELNDLFIKTDESESIPIYKSKNHF